MANELVRYDSMCHAIAAAYEVDEVKDIRDRAIAIAAYARQIRNLEAESLCAKIRVRAERRAGQLLRDMEKPKGAPGNQHTGPLARAEGSKTLGDLGVTYDQSSQWQKLAALPQSEFEAELNSQWKPTATSIINTIVPPPKPTPVSTEALWLWGRLEEFKREALGRDPAEFLATLTLNMLDDVTDLLPHVILWLEQARELCQSQKLDR